MRVVVRALLLAGFLASISAAQNAWRYIPAKSPRIVSMEWRKVLESPYSAALRRELPPETAAALGGINIIEGIERLVLAADESGTLIVLEGTFDRLALKDSAASEGAIVKLYKGMEIIAPADFAEDDVLMALVGARHILLGYERTLTRAIDRAETSRAGNRASKYDLWIAAGASEVGWHIGETLMVSGKNKTLDVALEFKNPSEYAAYAGRFRTQVESGTPPVAIEPARQESPPDPSGKIRIYGLDEGVREIQLTKPKQ